MNLFDYQRGGDETNQRRKDQLEVFARGGTLWRTMTDAVMAGLGLRKQ